MDEKLVREVEQFLYREARWLDERRFHEWLELLTEDIRYWMPVRTSRYPRSSKAIAMADPDRYVVEDSTEDVELAILDETDSGLDIDALKTVSAGVNKLKRPDNAQLVITHYQRLLNYIVPDCVHVMVQGRIVRSGGKELALELEERGYDWVTPRIQEPATV